MLRSALPIALLSIFSAVALAACGSSSIDSGVSEAPLDSESVAVGDSESAAVADSESTARVETKGSTLNLCKGQLANSFHCIDDTNFQQCIGGDQFVVNACPKGFCATRHPSIKNPCVGAARATEIDGVPPTPAGKLTP